MKINSTTPSLTPEARSFLEMLEFRVNRSDRGASVLSIGAGGGDREFAPVHLWPDEITNEQHLRHYGIMDRSANTEEDDLDKEIAAKFRRGYPIGSALLLLGCRYAVDIPFARSAS